MIMGDTSQPSGKCGRESRFVADGQERVVEANIDEIRAKVRAKWADQLAKAGWLRRIIIRAKIDREVLKELEEIAPSDGLYFAATRRMQRSDR